MLHLLKPPAKPADLAIPWGAAIGISLAFLWVFTVGAAVDMDWGAALLQALPLGVNGLFQSPQYLLLLLPLAATRLKGRWTAALLLGSIVIAFLAYDAYLLPFYQRFLEPNLQDVLVQQWYGHQVLTAVLGGTDPRGHYLDAMQEYEATLKVWGYLGTPLLLLSPGLAFLGRRRIRLHWAGTLVLAVGVSFGSATLASLASLVWSPELQPRPHRIASWFLYLIPSFLIGLAILLVSARWGEVDATERPAPRAGVALLLRAAVGALLGCFLYASYTSWLSPRGWRVLLPREPLTVGQPAPPFDLESLSGERARLKDLSGRIVVLNYWATWCGPCREELPALARLEEEFAPRGLRILRVNLDESREEIEYYLKHSDQSFDVYPSNRSILEDYPQRGVPMTYLIDREGILRYSHAGYGEGMGDELRQQIVELLGGPGTNYQTGPANESPPASSPP